MHLHSAVHIILTLLFLPKLAARAALFEREFWRWVVLVARGMILFLTANGRTAAKGSEFV
jgi:hypothetical protein